MPSQLRTLALAVAVSLGTAAIAPAGEVQFNMSSLTTSSTASQISSLLSSQMGSTVTVSSGVQVNTNYNADENVTGPVIGGVVTQWTLGDSGGSVTAPTAPTSNNPSYSAYLATTSSFTITFSAPVTSVEFDFEIFPDASPPVPTFEFSATDASNHASTLYVNGSSVGTSWTVNSVAPGANDPYLPGDPATYTHSQASGSGGTEGSYQLLGVASFQFSASDPAYSLTFADWPQEIGISNLVINNQAGFSAVAPAPPSAFLLGFGALGVAGFVARSRRRLPAAA
jgi:hypothetical protein